MPMVLLKKLRKIQSSQERIKTPAYRADVSQESVALQGGESSQERNGNLVAEVSQERPGVLAADKNPKSPRIQNKFASYFYFNY